MNQSVTILDLCGKGAYGEIYRVKDCTGRILAMKRIPKTTMGKFWEEEYRALCIYNQRGITHPHLMVIHHVWVDDSFLYYTTDLADNISANPEKYIPDTLSARIEKNALSAHEALYIGKNLCDAVIHLHSEGIIHHDIKPENVVFIKGEVVLVDIGICTNLDAPEIASGTFHYIPPEALQSSSAYRLHCTTPKVDFYALGKLLYAITSPQGLNYFPDYSYQFLATPEGAKLNNIIRLLCDNIVAHRLHDPIKIRELFKDSAPASRFRSTKIFSGILLLIVSLLTGIILWCYLPQDTPPTPLTPFSAINTPLSSPPKTKNTDININITPEIKIEFAKITPDSSLNRSLSSFLMTYRNDSRTSFSEYAFYMAKYEVTQALYSAVMGENPSIARAPQLPVNNLTHAKAQKFVQALNDSPLLRQQLPPGFIFSLPLAGEWCYAAFSGNYATPENPNVIPYIHGNIDNLNRIAVYESNSGGTPHPPGTKLPNRWGIFDLYGNISEWSRDPAQGDMLNYMTHCVGSIYCSHGGDFTCPHASLGFQTTCLANDSIPLRAHGIRLVARALSNTLPPVPSDDRPDTGLFSDRMIVFHIDSCTELKMMYIPEGNGVCGSPEDERGRFPDEKNQYPISLNRPFYAGKYEITQHQFESVMHYNNARFRYPNYPVERLSCNEAVLFCEKLNTLMKKTHQMPEGFKFTLPSHELWEYACRANSKTAFNHHFNLNSLNAIRRAEEIAIMKSNSGEKLHKVGKKLPNAWGLYDMHGNIYEYTQPYKVPVSSERPEGKECVACGGWWGSPAAYCRSAAFAPRDPAYPTSWAHGFRVFLVPDDLQISQHSR